MRAGLSVLWVVSLCSLSLPALADCRDARGEPIACAPPPAPPPPAPPPPVAASPVAPPPPSAPGHDHREHEVAYVEYQLELDVVDLSQLHFTPSSPGSVAAMARDGVAVGVGSPNEDVLGGFSMAVGVRPVPWLRFPQLRLSCGMGTLDSTVPLVGAAQPLTASFGDLYFLRAELGGGVDIDLDPVRLYALAHVALAGYFVSATVAHETLGDLGTDTYAKDTWEAGWTVGMEIELFDAFAYTLAFRHIHTGVESSSVFFGVNVRMR